jgi:hypothetical protein
LYARSRERSAPFLINPSPDKLQIDEIISDNYLDICQPNESNLLLMASLAHAR